jgi:signal transduction histidine kinase
MDTLTVVIAALLGILADVFYNVIRNYFAKKSDSEQLSVLMPSGQKVEIDAPRNDNKLLEEKIKSIIRSAEQPMSISKEHNINLLRDVVLPSASVFEKSLRKNNLNLVINEDMKKVPNINADTEALRQVFFNLLDNAIKYSSTGGTININGDESEDSVGVTITGSSSAYLKPSEIDYIFEKGYRGVQSLEANKTGTGLGLWVAKNLVEAHNGNLSIQPKENQITTKIRLPRETG